MERVAASGAYAVLWTGDGEVHVPLALVRSVRRPHFHEDDGLAYVPARPRRMPVPLPGQLSLDLDA